MLVLVLLLRDVLKEAHLLSGVNRKVFVFHEGRAVFIHSLASSAAWVTSDAHIGGIKVIRLSSEAHHLSFLKSGHIYVTVMISSSDGISIEISNAILNSTSDHTTWVASLFHRL